MQRHAKVRADYNPFDPDHAYGAIRLMHGMKMDSGHNRRMLNLLARQLRSVASGMSFRDSSSEIGNVADSCLTRS